MVTNLSVGKICGLVFLFFALTGSAFSQDPATGLSVYQSKCQRCHGVDARGNREISVALDIEFRYLGSAETQALTDLEIRQLIVRGKGKMQRVEGMTAPNVRDVIAYLRTLGGGMVRGTRIFSVL